MNDLADKDLLKKLMQEAGCDRVYNGMSMMLFQALIAIELYTGKSTPVDYMKGKTCQCQVHIVKIQNFITLKGNST